MVRYRRTSVLKNNNISANDLERKNIRKPCSNLFLYKWQITLTKQGYGSVILYPEDPNVLYTLKIHLKYQMLNLSTMLLIIESEKLIVKRN